MRIEIALEHIEDIMRIDLKIDVISKRIHAEIKASETTLTRVYGIGPINAALIIGEVGDVSRFPSRDHLASYTGTAPVAASSGDHHRHRLNRAGNRQLNHALYIAAITQIRNDTPGRDYYRRKLAAGKSTKEALRCLMRRINDAVWRQLRLDWSPDQTQDQSWPRWPSKRGNLQQYRSPDTVRMNGRPQPFKPANV
jgi:transposase